MAKLGQMTVVCNQMVGYTLFFSKSCFQCHFVTKIQRIATSEDSNKTITKCNNIMNNNNK